MSDLNLDEIQKWSGAWEAAKPKVSTTGHLNIAITYVKELLTHTKDLGAENKRLREGHIRCHEDSDYCYVCDCHQHAKDCPVPIDTLKARKG